MDYQERLLHEYAKLIERIIRLENYIDTNETTDNTLIEQFVFMNRYLEILRNIIIDEMHK